MPFNIEAARQAGWSDQEIENYLKPTGRSVSTIQQTPAKPGKSFSQNVGNILPAGLATAGSILGGGHTPLSAALAGAGAAGGTGFRQAIQGMQGVGIDDLLKIFQYRNAPVAGYEGTIASDIGSNAGQRAGRALKEQAVAGGSAAILDALFSGVSHLGSKALGPLGKLPILQGPKKLIGETLQPIVAKTSGAIDDLLAKLPVGGLQVDDILKALQGQKEKSLVQTSGDPLAAESIDEVTRRLTNPYITTMAGDTGIDPIVVNQIKTGLGKDVFSKRTGQLLNPQGATSSAFKGAEKVAGGGIKEGLEKLMQKAGMGTEYGALRARQAAALNLIREMSYQPLRPNLLTTSLSGLVGSIVGGTPGAIAGAAAGLSSAPFIKNLYKQLIGGTLQGAGSKAAEFPAQLLLQYLLQGRGQQ